GIEAATVAWHGMGWQPLAFSEIEPFPSAVLGHHYPDVPNLGDMTDYLNWPEELLLECEILVGGTPCQAFSVAGKRESLGDERGNLSLVFCNLYHHINEIRRRHGRPPAIVVWENVPGVLSTKDNAFGCFLAGIMGLDEAVETESGKWHKAGFLSGETVRVGYRIIDAQYFGVAQRRRRVFLVAVPCELVASLGERACPSEILSLRESVLGNPPTRGAAWEDTAGSTGDGVARCVTAGEAKRQDWETCNFVAFTKAKRAQSSTDDESWVPGEVAPTQNQFDVGDTRATTVVAFTQNTRDEVREINGDGNIAGALAANSGMKQTNYLALSFKPGQSEAAGGTFVTNEFTPTVQSQNNGSTAIPAVQRAMQVRRLTPTECERLQGFPDHYTDVTYRKKPAADGPRYKALGNSMAVPCMAWIGYRIEKATRGNI
ncbi:MAG: DNA (cytosine-5-)-methyltransferase, partial [Ilumatobacteraceae bacterium]